MKPVSGIIGSFVFLLFCLVNVNSVDARTVKKCIAVDGSTTYATSCPSDSTESEEILKIYDTESPDPGNTPGIGNTDSGSDSGGGSSGITVVGEDSGSGSSSGGGSLSSGGGATGGGSAGGAPSGGGAGSGDSGGGADGQASSDGGGDSGSSSSSSTESAASTTTSDSTSSTDSDSTTDGPTGSSTSSPSGTASNAPAGSPDSDTSTTTSSTTTDSSSDSSTISATEPEPSVVTSPSATPPGVRVPIINDISGSITDGTVVTITGKDFTDKQRQQPWFYWTADDGKNPSFYGYKKSWDNFFQGEITTVITAPRSSQAVRFDHSNQGEPVPRIEFNSDYLYVYRKIYQDFTIKEATLLRTNVTNVSGAPIVAGQIIKGVQSGATGVVQSFNGSQIFYESSGGSINVTLPTKPEHRFIKGEVMKSYAASDTSFTTPLATMTNNDPYGTFRTFNYKIWRFWYDVSSPSEKNNIYTAMAAKQDTDTFFLVFPEYTNASGAYFWSPDKVPHIDREWISQEIVYKTSSVGVQDGITSFIQNGIAAVDESDRKFTHRNSTYSKKYRQFNHSQVSGGAQPGTWVYYDQVYIDDSWHRVILCSGSTWETCRDREIQIVSTWTDTSIKVRINLGGLDTSKPVYLYVVNKDNIASNAYQVN